MRTSSRKWRASARLTCVASVAMLAIAACTEADNSRPTPVPTPSEPIESATPVFPKLDDKITAGALLEPEPFFAKTDKQAERTISQAGLDALKAYEGEVLCQPTTETSFHCPYDDSSDFCTIGHGHLIAKASCATLVPKLEEIGYLDGISKAEADDLLISDLTSSQLSLERHMSRVDGMLAEGLLGKVGLTETQYDALVSFIFNVGGGGFSASTLLRVLKARDQVADSAEIARQFTRWTRSAGKHFPGLLNRRNREVDQFFEGFERPVTARTADDDDSLDIRVGEQAPQ